MAPSVHSLLAGLVLGLTFSTNASPTPENLATAVLPACSTQPCGQICADSTGTKYKILCKTNISGLNIAKRELAPRQYEAALQDCLRVCDGNPGCKGVSYTDERLGRNCELYGSVTGHHADADFTAAIKQ